MGIQAATLQRCVTQSVTTGIPTPERGNEKIRRRCVGTIKKQLVPALQRGNFSSQRCSFVWRRIVTTDILTQELGNDKNLPEGSNIELDVNKVMTNKKAIKNQLNSTEILSLLNNISNSSQPDNSADIQTLDRLLDALYGAVKYTASDKSDKELWHERMNEKHGWSSRIRQSKLGGYFCGLTNKIGINYVCYWIWSKC